MAFDTLSAFLAMGGHGIYVWPSWGVTALLIIALSWHARHERKRLVADIRRREKRDRGRQQSPSSVEVSPFNLSERRSHDS